MEKIGLIAGNRRFPLMFSEAAKKKGQHIVAVAIKGETSPALKRYVDKLYWLKLAEFKKMNGIFKAEGVKKVVMAGQVSPFRLFSREVRESSDIQKLLSGIENLKASTIFSAIADQLKESGLELIDSTTFIEDLLPDKGTLTQREPTFDEWESVYFGLELARQIAHLDIGQSIAVKKKAVVAVEALEGTDNLIRRAGKLGRGGVVVIKVSRPAQDMRFDIPVVGLQTIKTLIGASATCLAIEAKKTLFIDMQLSLALADKKNLAIVAV